MTQASVEPKMIKTLLASAFCEPLLAVPPHAATNKNEATSIGVTAGPLAGLLAIWVRRPLRRNGDKGRRLVGHQASWGTTKR